METIGLIAAMSMESEALLRHIRGWTRTAWGPLRGVRLHIAGKECVLVTSGMGIPRAARAARLLIDAANPRWLVSFGIAGSVQEDLRIGDVVMATQNSSLENGLLSPFQPLAILSTAAQDSISQALRPGGARLVHGTVVTTRGSQLILRQAEQILNPVLEMETAGILQAAAGTGVPLVSLRSVSDNPRTPIPFNLESIVDDEFHYRIGRMVSEVLRRPRLLLQARQMIRNSRIAADNAAIAVITALSQKLPLATS